jgi:hypothetical protein
MSSELEKDSNFIRKRRDLERKFDRDGHDLFGDVWDALVIRFDRQEGKFTVHRTVMEATDEQTEAA